MAMTAHTIPFRVVCVAVMMIVPRRSCCRCRGVYPTVAMAVAVLLLLGRASRASRRRLTAIVCLDPFRFPPQQRVVVRYTNFVECEKCGLGQAWALCPDL